MTDLITVTGIVGSDPRAIRTSQQLPITSFRLASARRYYNRATDSWEDAGTNWYTVSAFRNLAFNANASLRKGEHVIVHGRLKQREWQAGDKSGVAIEIEADAIGHDLNWGLTLLTRLEQAPRSVPADPATEEGAGGGASDSAEQPGADDERAHAAAESDEHEPDDRDDPDDPDDLDDLDLDESVPGTNQLQVSASSTA